MPKRMMPVLIFYHLNNMTKENEFSIEIKGSGTREDVIASLKEVIAILEEELMECLQEGQLNYEDATLTADSGESYE